MNHTCNEHPSFQQPDNRIPVLPNEIGTSGRRMTRCIRRPGIIFVDTEKSNWTWHEEAGAYYWHRFFGRQPDLNYDNPEVQEQMLAGLKFWLDLGLDVFRLRRGALSLRA